MGVRKADNSNFCNFAILISQLPIGFIAGVALTFLNSSAPALEVFINDSYVDRYRDKPTQQVITFVLTFAQSVLIWGSLVGALLVKPTLQRFSRRGALLIVHGINVFSVVLMAPVAKFGKSYESLIFGRLMCGITRGLGFSINMVFVAETSCRSRLGFFQGPFSVVIFVASAVGAGLGHSKVLGTPNLWAWTAVAQAFVSVLYFVSFPWLPNTPVYLLKHGQRDKALETLKKLRVGEVEDELKIIQDEINEESNTQVNTLKTILSTPRLRMQFFTAILVAISPQLAGIQPIFMYSDSLLLQAGVDAQYVTFATMGMFLQSAVAFAIFIPTQRRFGTKRVYIAGLVIAAIGYIIFTTANALHKTIPWMSYLALVFIFVLLFGVQFGPQLTMQSLPAELTTATSRPTLAFYSGIMFWLLGGIISSVFPYSVIAWGAYAYIPCIILTLLLIPFGIFAIPETHKRSAAQVQRSFRKKSTQSLSVLFSISRSASEVQNSSSEGHATPEKVMVPEVGNSQKQGVEFDL